MAKKLSLSEKIDQSMDKTMRAVRIGTCYNGFTQMMDTKNTPIDLSKLNGAQKLLFVDGTAEFRFEANSGNSSTANSSQWGLDTKLGGGAFGIKASAGYSMQKVHAHTTENKGINAVISNKYQGQYFQLQDSSEETLFNCMSDDFKSRFTAIMKAETATEKQTLYLKFIEDYGTGCVTTLYLEAGSIANIYIATDQSADSNEANYGASLAVSSSYVNASGAANWGNSYKTANIKGTADIKSTSYPQGAPTQAWVNALATTFAGKAIEELTKSANFANLPEPKFDKAPDYPKKDEPSKDKIVKNGIDFSDEMKQKLMKDDNFSGSWDAYVKAQKEALEKCTPKDIVEGTARLAEERTDALLFEHTEAERPKMFAELFQDTEEDTNLGEDNPWSLGGYIPIDFEVTPWEELFPSLAAPFQFTSSSIRFAKLMSFYYTRLQFGQYLSFLSNVGDAYVSKQKDFLPSDVDNYYSACKGYFQDMIANLPASITEQDYKNWTSCFGKYLKNINFQGNPVIVDGKVTPIEFFNGAIYNIFFKNYAFFDRCCFGIVYRYTYFTDLQTVTRNADIAKIIVPSQDFAKGQCNNYIGTIDSAQHSLRFYPVLEIADKKSEGYAEGEVIVTLVYYADKKFYRFSQHTLDSEVNGGLSQTHKRSVSLPERLISEYFKEEYSEMYWPYWDADNKAYKSEMPLLCMKPIGNPEFNTVKASGKTMKGITPMFQDFPFDLAQAYPKGA